MFFRETNTVLPMTTAKLQISTDETTFIKTETKIKFMTLIYFLSKFQLILPRDIN